MLCYYLSETVIAKIKFVNVSSSKEFYHLATSTWVFTTRRDIQPRLLKLVLIIIGFALKCAFGEAYNEVYSCKFILRDRIMPIFYSYRIGNSCYWSYWHILWDIWIFNLIKLILCYSRTFSTLIICSSRGLPGSVTYYYGNNIRVLQN